MQELLEVTSHPPVLWAKHSIACFANRKYLLGWLQVVAKTLGTFFEGTAWDRSCEALSCYKASHLAAD